VNYAVLRRPWWIAALSLVGWLGCTLIVVTFDGDSNSEQWLAAAGSTLGAGFAAGIVGGGLVSWWEARERRWAPRRPMFDLLNTATDCLNDLLSRLTSGIDAMAAEHAVDAPGPGLRAATYLLPVTDAQRGLAAEVKQVHGAVVPAMAARYEKDLLAAVQGGPFPGEHRSVRWRFLAIAAEGALTPMRKLLDVLEQIGVTLDRNDTSISWRLAYLEPAVRSLEDASSEDVSKARIGFEGWDSLLETIADTADTLTELYESLEQETTDPWLKRRLADQRRRHDYREVRRSATEADPATD